MTDLEKVIKEFELFIKEFHPACTSEGVELDMFREVLALLKEQESVIEALKSDLSETLQVLSEQPTIVLCKDCKHFNDMKCSYPERGTCNLWHTLHWGEWFCASGERKD